MKHAEIQGEIQTEYTDRILAEIHTGSVLLFLPGQLTRSHGAQEVSLGNRYKRCEGLCRVIIRDSLGPMGPH